MRLSLGKKIPASLTVSWMNINVSLNDTKQRNWKRATYYGLQVIKADGNTASVFFL